MNTSSYFRRDFFRSDLTCLLSCKGKPNSICAVSMNVSSVFNKRFYEFLRRFSYRSLLVHRNLNVGHERMHKWALELHIREKPLVGHKSRGRPLA